MRLSFWMGHPWGPLQTTSEQIDQLSVSGGYLDTLTTQQLVRHVD
jgi:hypothetical protein